jgi:hypothetical protein
MYPSVLVSDTTRRDLANDDRLAVCDLYPAGALPCDRHAASSGCTNAGPWPAGNQRWPTVFAVAIWILAVMFFRVQWKNMRQSKDTQPTEPRPGEAGEKPVSKPALRPMWQGGIQEHPWHSSAGPKA